MRHQLVAIHGTKITCETSHSGFALKDLKFKVFL